MAARLVPSSLPTATTDLSVTGISLAKDTDDSLVSNWLCCWAGMCPVWGCGMAVRWWLVLWCLCCGSEGFLCSSSLPWLTSTRRLKWSLWIPPGW